MRTIIVDRKQYLSDRMAKVSRSFALVVRCLEPSLDDLMATAYLLCRVADNIEDCTQPGSWQRSRFAEFKELLNSPEDAAHVLAHWELLDWPGLTPDESAMMGVATGLPLWQIYEEIDGAEGDSIRQWVSTMATGMERLDDPRLPPRIVGGNGVRYLATVPDYNEYCYFVAGTVGHMATEIVAQHYGFQPDVVADLSALSEACGRGLQKTNIVKDFKDDLARGMSYLPGTWLEQAGFDPLRLRGAPSEWTQMVVGDVVNELRTATDYLLRLPTDAQGYRMASLLCLLPAYQTVLSAARRSDRLFTAKHQVKISQVTMLRCQSDARAMISENDAIRDYGRRMEDKIDAAFGGR